MSKGLKSVAKIALPVAASFIPGIGPLGAAALGAAGGALGGGGLKGALLGGLTSGLGSGIFGGIPGASGIGFLDSLNSGAYGALSPLRSLAGGLLGGGSSGSSPLSFLSGGSSQTAEKFPWQTQAASSASKTNFPWIKDVMAGKILPNSSMSDYMSAGQPQGILSRLSDAISNPSLKDATSVLSIVDALRGEESRGMLNQQDILNQMNADKAKQDQQAEKFIASLNSSPLQRVQTNPSVDYYSYGTRPEVKFFDKVGAEPIKFARGGKVPAIDSMKGQADTVHAKLSEGEYVIPADVVSHLGDGNSVAGAKALDAMLKQVRQTKAPAMKKGALPPKAKSPLAYVGKVA